MVKRIGRFCLVALLGIMIVAPLPIKAETYNFANIVVFVRFKDDTKDYMNYLGSDYSSLTNYQVIRQLYTGGMTPDSSFKTYLNSISDGKFNPEIIIPQGDDSSVNLITLNHTYQDCVGFGNNGDDFYIVEDTINAINTGNLLAGKNLDYNNDGAVDNLTIIVQGKSSYNDGIIYPHKAEHSNPNHTINGKYIATYNIIDSGSLVKNGPEDQSVLKSKSGVLVHEFLHSLGLPDLYRYSISGNPVGVWSIMALTGMYLQYPLEYFIYQLGWFDKTEEEMLISESGTYTLDLNTSSHGNRMLMIKTPINSSEFFCLEYRYGGNDWQNDAYDAKMPDNGVLVYRINPLYYDIGNANGNNYVYVFRPNATSLNDDSDHVFQAAISPSESMGTASFDDSYEKNTIYYSDGSNSGIVIDNVIMSTDKQTITFDVSFPDYSSIGVWETEATLQNFNNPTLGVNEDKIVMAASYYDYNISPDALFTQVKQWNNGQLENIGSPIANFFVQSIGGINGTIYAIGEDKNNFFQVYQYDGSWKLVRSKNEYAANVGTFIFDGKGYSYYFDTGNGKNRIVIESLDGTTVLPSVDIESYRGSFVNYNGQLYMGLQTSQGAKIYTLTDSAWQEQKAMGTKTNDQIQLKVDGDRLYALNHGTDITPTLYQYEGTQWNSKEFPELTSANVNMQVSDGIIYFSHINKAVAETFYYSNGELSKLKSNIATSVNELKSCIMGESIYHLVGNSETGTYYLKSSILVENEHKATGIEISGSLSKTDYILNDTLDLSGLVVTATYEDGSTKEVTHEISLPQLVGAGLNQEILIFYQNVNATLSGVNVYSILNEENISFSQTDIAKHGENTGSITLNTALGILLKGEIEVSVNQDAFEKKTQFENLGAGEYSITLRDSVLTNNSYTTSVTLGQPEVISLSVDKESVSLVAGGSVQITPSIEVSMEGSKELIYQSEVEGLSFVEGVIRASSDLAEGNYEVKVISKEDESKELTISVHIIPLNSLAIELPEGFSNSAVFVDGVEYAGVIAENQVRITVKDNLGKIATVYHYKENGAPDKMAVYELTYQNDFYNAKHIEAFDNLISYHGYSMRITGITGVRFKSGIDKTVKKQLASSKGLEGYHLVETGTVLMYQKFYGKYPLIKNGKGTLFGRAYYTDNSGSKVDSIYETIDNRERYTSVVTGISEENYDTNYSFRGYVILEKEGQQVYVYGPIVSKSMYTVATQVKATGQYKPGTNAYNFIQDIIDTVDKGATK